MRKLTGAVFQSLDGVMQAPGGPQEDPSGGFKFGGWTAPFWDESMNGPAGKLFDELEYDLLLAKRTYYEPAGQVPIGSFAMKAPSEAELRRREAWAKEEA